MKPLRSTAVEELLEGVVAYELWGDGDPAWLADDEWPIVEDAVASRIQQFAGGRQCARMALAEFGVEPKAVLRSTSRSPAWPEGFVGSISHTDGYALAVVGRSGAGLASLGIDAERVGRVGEELHDRLFVVDEQRWLTGLAGDVRAAAATELFGLKESFYKAQFPLTEAWVGFHDVGIEQRESQWILNPATDIDALHAIRWPVVGHTLVRRGIVVSVVSVVAPA